MTELQTPAREISSADVEAYLAAGGKVTLGEPAVAPGADAPNVKIAASRSRRQAPAPQEPAPLEEGEPEPQEPAPPSSEKPEPAVEESESRELAPAPSPEVLLTQAILAAYSRGVGTDAILHAIEGAREQQPQAAAPTTKTGKIPDYRKLKFSKDDVIVGVPAVNPWKSETKGAAYFKLIQDGMTVEEAVKAGCPRSYIAWNVAHGYHAIKPAKD